MKWFTTPTDEDRSHERIMAILDSIDPVELFGNTRIVASTDKPSTATDTRE